MPFEKGRPKTGGRQKGGPARKSTRFVDQLSHAGFSYVKELADVLKAIKELRNTAPDPVKAAELKFFYTELKYLLPYMAPKLREKDVEVVESIDAPEAAKNPVSTDDLLSALGHGKDDSKDKSRSSNSTPLGTGSAPLQVPTRPEENLRDLAGEQEEDE